jgi:predicted nucleic acid-binding protein
VARRPIRTFLDSGVLIAAYRGATALEEPALRILKDPTRVFLSSPFVRHEVLPKAIFNRQQGESRFYQNYFRRCLMLNDLKLILRHASKESARSGVGAMDSLHLAAAHLLRADLFITTEKPSRSVYRSSLVNIVYLYG